MIEMKRLLVFLLCASAVFLSCKDNQIGSALASAEISMNDNPKSSLEVLESIDKDLLSTRKQKAKYALLYSIALDKNYIDLQSDSIIAPAVKYYECNGSKEERFLCNYYRARICENAGDYESALLYAARAESVDTSQVSAENKSLLYAMKGTIYHNEWRIQEALESYILACKYALESDKYRHFAHYALRVAHSYRYNFDLENSYRYIRLAEKYKDYFTLTESHIYHAEVLLYMMETDFDPLQCIQYAEQYISDYPQENQIRWHIIAQVYHYAGESDKAYRMLQKYSKYHDISSSMEYYGTLADVLNTIGNYKDALEAHKTFASLVKNRDVQRHRSDIKLKEEHFKNEIIQTRQKHLTSYIIGIMILFAVITVYLYVRWRRESNRSLEDLSELQKEYDVLLSLKERMDGTYQYLNNQITGIYNTDQELKIVLGHRLKSLSSFLQKPVPDSLSKVAPQIEDLKKNKNQIVDSV